MSLRWANSMRGRERGLLYRQNEGLCDSVLLSQTNTRGLSRGELGHGLHIGGWTNRLQRGWRACYCGEPRPTAVPWRMRGGPDGPRDAPNHLSGSVSGLRTDAPPACPCAASRPRYHALAHRRAWRPCPGMSGWAYVPHLVQCVPPSVVSAVRLSPDRALARAPACPAAGL
jgi:hypothetical protein